MPCERPASLATSPNVVLPMPLRAMHFIVASMSCWRLAAREAVRLLGMGAMAAINPSCHKMNEYSFIFLDYEVTS